jgi:transcriptional regulator with XRE-family HTH domain
MKESPTSIDKHLARRVRSLRKQCSLTLDELAERSGVSRSMVSLVERGESSPTAKLLERLSAALGVTLAALFAEETRSDASPVSRRSDQNVWRDPETGYLRRNLSPPAYASPIDLVEVILPPSTRVPYHGGFRAARHYQQIWVLEGAVQIQVGSESHLLEQGDCLAMVVDGPTAFQNDKKKRARYLVAVTAGP